MQSLIKQQRQNSNTDKKFKYHFNIDLKLDFIKPHDNKYDVYKTIPLCDFNEIINILN